MSNPHQFRCILKFCAVVILFGSVNPAAAGDFERIGFNYPGLIADLGVGLWAKPLPLDYDGDGDYDLLVSSNDKPHNGIYFFENTRGNVKMPVFKPGKRIGDAVSEIQISYIRDGYRILTPGFIHPAFKTDALTAGEPIPYKPEFYHGRANQWYLCDYDGDGLNDLIIGISDWREYGWDNAFDARGIWRNGPLHGYVYFMKNNGTNEKPVYESPERIKTADGILDVYGRPSPNFADFDGDGDLDLICGEFLDRMTYFENTGSRRNPVYAAGTFLSDNGSLITMDLEMIVPTAIDWDSDGDSDLLVGDEDGRVAFVENTGEIRDGIPHFLQPVYFEQEADGLKAGALVTPCSFDWDSDGDEDIICGNSAGYLFFIENLDGGNPPRWARPRKLESGGDVFRIMAGQNGSIQGPAEAKWGYTVCTVADWDHDGLHDVIVNSILGKIVWLKNTGTNYKPLLDAPRAVEVAWPGKPPKPVWNWREAEGRELITQWRTSPVVYDLNEDGLNDLIMLDHEGFLACYERERRGSSLILLPGKRIFLDGEGRPLRLNAGEAGKSGRRKFVLCDWDMDGKIDLLVNSVNISFMKNIAEDAGKFMFVDRGPLGKRTLAGHTTCPAVVDWDKNRIPDILAGAEDGFFYYIKNPAADRRK